MQVIVYTDGSALGNPGPGGYGVILTWGTHVKELSAGYRHTTNNRMELLAVIVALETLTRDGLDVVVYTDSQYVQKAITEKWVFGWEKKGFAGKKNPDLWKRFLVAYRRHKVTFQWVKGHAGHPQNERCDQLATSAARGTHHLPDLAYERGEAG
ncbi:MAG: ribonuclease HI [Bacteroidia bacterium]|nr:ribonuclease HI [Bacteroidia bacterium]